MSEKYLGLPILVGKAKNRSFQSIKDRVWKRVKGWKEKMLSFGGKEILIKVVAQAIPRYLMSCFKIPKSLCTKPENIMGIFWWGHNTDDKKNPLA